jgi:hypothetical protein
MAALTSPGHTSFAASLRIGGRTRDDQHNLAWRRRRACLGRRMAGREAFCEKAPSARQTSQDGRGVAGKITAGGVQPWRRADVRGRRLVPDRGISSRLNTVAPLREGRSLRSAIGHSHRQSKSGRTDALRRRGLCEGRHFLPGLWADCALPSFQPRIISPADWTFVHIRCRRGIVGALGD